MESSIVLDRRENIPSWAFRLMTLSMKFRDLFSSPALKLNNFGIQTGDTIIDYGCGPGRYLRKASQLTGPSGKVYAVDIHKLAINCARKLIRKKKLTNIIPVQATDYFVPIQENKADLIFALDMFHMVSQPNEFLNELHRLLKPSGRLILEDGHQKRSKALEKINLNKRWEIQKEEKKHLILSPRYKISY